MPEEVKDKTTEEVKFSPEGMTQVQNIQQSYLTVQNQFGQLKLAQIKLDEDEVQLEENLNQLKEEERTFLSGITKKYGEGTLNPETGVFTPNKS